VRRPERAHADEVILSEQAHERVVGARHDPRTDMRLTDVCSLHHGTLDLACRVVSGNSSSEATSALRAASPIASSCVEAAAAAVPAVHAGAGQLRRCGSRRAIAAPNVAKQHMQHRQKRRTSARGCVP
jgi:hypothetical protein